MGAYRRRISVKYLNTKAAHTQRPPIPDPFNIVPKVGQGTKELCSQT